MGNHKVSANLPIVVFADDWGRHPSSCQHLIRRLRQHYPVLWVNTIGTRQVRADSFTFRRGLEKIKSWGQGLTRVTDQMWVLDVPMLPNQANRWIRKINGFIVTHRIQQTLKRLHLGKPIVLTTLPYVVWLVSRLARQALVYYCTDDYSHWPSADKQTLQEADSQIRKEANLTLAASKLLLKPQPKKSQCYYFPHGVDFEHFRSTQEVETPPDSVSSLPEPRIGFFGLIYEKLDFELLTRVSQRFSHGSLVMVGPVTHCPEEFSSLPNVHFLGQKPYEELPQYLAGLDVLLLPYLDDPMIRQSGPLKLRECLASGKPTVSIDVPEVRLLEPHVRIGRNPEEFLSQIELGLQESGESTFVHYRQIAVSQDSWNQRAADLSGYFRTLIDKKKTNFDSFRQGANSQPRILHLRTVTGKGGGPEKTLLNSPRFLENRYQLLLAYIRPETDQDFDMPERAKQMGADLVDIPESGAVDPRTPLRLAKVIHEFRPDLLHAHDYKTNVFAIALGLLFQIPVMTTLHGYVTRGRRLERYYSIDRWTLRHMRHIVGVSHDLRDLVAGYRIPSARFSLIENAIDLEQYTRVHSISQGKDRYQIDQGCVVVGAVGRLAPEKGFDLLIQAIDGLLNKGVNLHLMIIGEGDERQRLESLIAQHGREDRIRLLGYRSDVRFLYECMDIFALSSLREGLPNVVLEAMALGVPVVSTKVAGVPQLITHEVNGLLAECGSAEALATQLERLIHDAEMRQQLSHNARETIESKYSFRVRMDKIRAIYDGLLGRKS